MRDAAYRQKCVCAETNMRHCSIHGQGEVVKPSAVEHQMERLNDARRNAIRALWVCRNFSSTARAALRSQVQSLRRDTR